MAKVKCCVCANEIQGKCKIKRSTVNLNKKRVCDAYVYDSGKFKAKQDIPVTKVSYREIEAVKKVQKMERKRIRKLAKEGPANKEAEKLGLLGRGYTAEVSSGDRNVPIRGPQSGDSKHPLTGDLSRFMTTAKKDKE